MNSNSEYQDFNAQIKQLTEKHLNLGHEELSRTEKEYASLQEIANRLAHIRTSRELDPQSMPISAEQWQAFEYELKNWLSELGVSLDDQNAPSTDEHQYAEEVDQVTSVVRKIKASLKFIREDLKKEGLNI